MPKGKKSPSVAYIGPYPGDDGSVIIEPTEQDADYEPVELEVTRVGASMWVLCQCGQVFEADGVEPVKRMTAKLERHTC